MGIISTPAVRRRKFIFKPIPIRVKDEDGTDQKYPSIVLWEKETGVPVAFPGYERWYIRLDEAPLAWQTLKKTAYSISAFLNFLLWDTSCDSLDDVTLDHLRAFVSHFRVTSDGDERDPTEWERGISFVWTFLGRYYSYKSETVSFHFCPSDLYAEVVVADEKTGRAIIQRRYKTFFVKAPKKRNKKYRYIPEGYLGLLLFEAKKHDPMLALAIALQAYAGLREGEIVNLTRESIRLKNGGLGTISGIEINLQEQAPFSYWDKKTDFGSIKVFRKQLVYPDFVDDAKSLYQRHEELLKALGAASDAGAPLFVDSRGKPMSVGTYTRRLKELFYAHFLPDLTRLCEYEGTWAENAPFIEAYEKEYPGAHSLRHRFSMYLIVHTGMSREEIAAWRGDASKDAVDDYVHKNAEMLHGYKQACFTFQRWLLNEVLS